MKKSDLIVLRSSSKFAAWDVITIVEAAVSVLSQSDVFQKARLTKRYCEAWKDGRIHRVSPSSEPIAVPPSPARPTSDYVQVPVDQQNEHQQKLARMLKKNTVEVTVHGIANAESYAIDLFWDLLARYWDITTTFPKEYVDDLVYIAEQEAYHFLSWDDRLRNFGLNFGCFPFQDGLWQSATDTSGDILARLAVINLTHEAKGLDTYAKSRQKLVQIDDKESVAILDHNYKEEIGHVAIGVKWFKEICKTRGFNSPIEVFHELSGKFFKGKLREPFNHEARKIAGMTEEWYLPIAG